MSRISKAKAHELAQKLTKNNRKKVDLLEKLTKQQITRIADAAIPKDLAIAFKDFGEYMKSNSCVSFTSERDSFSYYLDKHYPSKNGFTAAVIRLNDDVFEEVRTLVKKLDFEKADFLELVEDLSKTIYSLGSQKRIIATFPSLENEFEAQTTKLPSNIESLKSRIIYG